MKIKKFNINILLSLFTLTKVYSMQEQTTYTFNKDAALLELNWLFPTIHNTKKTISTLKLITIDNEGIISSLNPFSQYILKLLNYISKNYIKIKHIIFNINEKNLYIEYNELLMDYLNALEKITLTIRNFDKKVDDKAKKEMLKKEIKNVFQNPEEFNYNSFLSKNDNKKGDQEVYHFVTFTTEENKNNLKEDIKNIKCEIAKIKKIEEIIKNISSQNK